MKTGLTKGGLLLGMWLMTSCTGTMIYDASRQQPGTSRPQTVAILPVEVDYTGPLPDRSTKEDLHAMDIGESLMYQRSLYHALLRQSAKGLDLQIQPIERTNSILQENHISATDSWRKDPQALAQLLGVDAVVRTTLSENRYQADQPWVNSPYPLGMPYGYRWGYNPWAYPPYQNGIKTADLQATTAVFDRKTGDLLWRITSEQAVGIGSSSKAQVQQMMNKVARRLPYQK